MLQMTILRWASSACVLSMSLPAYGQQPNIELDSIIAPFSKPDSPGCAVAAERGGQRIATHAFGLADLEHSVPNTHDTVFEAGSVSKQFTAAATLLLVEEGKLKLDDDIRKYLPEMPDYGTPVTIDHLMNHTSGLRDWGVVAGVTGWPRGTRAYINDDALRIAAAQRSLNYPPGSEYSYTNTGYNMLAVIVQRVTGQSLAAFTKARLFEPLGMTSTSWRDDFQRIVKNRAVAYMPADGGGYAEDRPFENDYGNGGLLTTVGDLMLWNAALTSGKLGAEVTAQLQERATLSSGQRITYARGLVVSQHKGAATVSHGGATGGYRAWIERFPASGLSIGVLCNGANINPGQIARQIADTALGLQDAPAKGIAVKGLDANAGMYVNASTGATLWLDVTDSAIKLRGGPALTPLDGGRFQSAAGQFVFNSADSFTLTDNSGQPMRFERTEPVTLDASLDRYAGTFASAEASGVRYAVTLGTAGTLTLQLLDRSDPKFAPPIILKPTYKNAFEDGNGVTVRFEPDAMVLGMPRLRALRFVRE